MTSVDHLLRRALAVGLACALLAPLVGAMHVHEVDHDGVTQHIEAAHGSHLPAVADDAERVVSGGPKSPAVGIPAEMPTAPGGCSPVGEIAAEGEPHPPPQPPPCALRSRAPPA